jgi:hypothetical protein
VLKKIDDQWFKGTFMWIKDEGKLNPGSVTKRFSVTTNDGQHLGFVRWMTPWRKYSFFTNEIVLEETCMSELVEFLTQLNAEHKAKR